MGKSILVVDDKYTELAEVIKALGRQKYKTLSAINGKETLEIVSARPLDLVLLDIKLPDIDGKDLLVKIKKTRPALPVIMITGYDDYDDCVFCLKAGAFHYLVKPVAMKKLVSVVEEALESQEPTDRLQ